MQQNIGPLDRAIRLIVGIGLLSLVFVGPQTWWGLVGLVPLVTSLIGWCPPYAMFGLNTCSARREAR
jgi:hypothetical protein